MWVGQAGEFSHLSAYFCHRAAAPGQRYPDGADVARTCRRAHHADLYPCAGPGVCGRAQPAGVSSGANVGRAYGDEWRRSLPGG